MSLCSYRSGRSQFTCPSKSLLCIVASYRDISPTIHEPRLLPIYYSVRGVLTFLSRRCILIYQSLENDVTLISSGYSPAPGTRHSPAQYVQLSPTERLLRTASIKHAIVIQSFLHTCRPSSALRHLIDQFAVKRLKGDNMAYPQYPSFLNSTKFPKAFVSIDYLALDSCHFISEPLPLASRNLFNLPCSSQGHDNNQLTRTPPAM